MIYRGNEMELIITIEYKDGRNTEIPIGDKTIEEAIEIMDAILRDDRNAQTATIKKKRTNNVR